jgi:hypothetical protein
MACVTYTQYPTSVYSVFCLYGKLFVYFQIEQRPETRCAYKNHSWVQKCFEMSAKKFCTEL